MIGVTKAGSTTDFEQTLHHAKQGSEAAWRYIYTSLAPGVIGYLRSRGASDPEDLGGEVFLQVANNIHKFSGDESKFRSWVYVIAHRRLINAHRAAKRRPEVKNSTHLDDERLVGGDVERESMQELATSRMLEIFERLTEDQRRVLALRIVADFSLVETARVIGKRVNAVKSLQRRALATVHKHLIEEQVTL